MAEFWEQAASCTRGYQELPCADPSGFQPALKPVWRPWCVCQDCRQEVRKGHCWGHRWRHAAGSSRSVPEATLPWGTLVTGNTPGGTAACGSVLERKKMNKRQGTAEWNLSVRDPSLLHCPWAHQTHRDGWINRGSWGWGVGRRAGLKLGLRRERKDVFPNVCWIVYCLLCTWIVVKTLIGKKSNWSTSSMSQGWFSCGNNSLWSSQLLINKLLSSQYIQYIIIFEDILSCLKQVMSQA